MTIHSHKDLIVWQKSVDLVIAVYKITKKFPREELYGLISQIRRAVVSIPSNIAEGRGRGTKKDFVQFLRIAFGSCEELETQLEISKRLLFGDIMSYNESDNLLLEVKKMLQSMISKLSPRSE